VGLVYDPRWLSGVMTVRPGVEGEEYGYVRMMCGSSGRDTI
jgi:hypothetical protein